ncbi:MAG: type II secretion system protein GspG [Planctomycetota bacterium]
MTRPTVPTRARGFTTFQMVGAGVATIVCAAWVMPSHTCHSSRSKTHAAHMEANALTHAIRLYLYDHDDVIDSAFSLDRLVGDDELFELYRLREDHIIDPWNRQYLVFVPGVGDAPFNVVSLGKDGKPGGTGQNADIISES